MNITFLEAYEEYVQYYTAKRKGQSARSITSRFKNIIPYFPVNKNMRDITAKDYFNWQQSIESRNYSYPYKKTLHYAMVTFYNYCLLFYGIEYGITKNIPQMVGNFSDKDYIPKEMNYWTIEEYRQFNGVVNELIYKILFQFLYFTGCRLGEALALTFDDFNSDTKYISITKTLSKESINGKRIINTPKTKKSIRKILIDDKLVNDIKELREYYSTYYPDFNNNYYIFGGNKPLSPTTIERKKNNWCIESGVKQIRIHDFRHSHATILVNSDLPIKAISERLGHGDVAFTINTYVHTNSEDEKRVIRTLSSLHSLV